MKIKPIIGRGLLLLIALYGIALCLMLVLRSLMDGQSNSHRSDQCLHYHPAYTNIALISTVFGAATMASSRSSRTTLSRIHNRLPSFFPAPSNQLSNGCSSSAHIDL